MKKPQIIFLALRKLVIGSAFLALLITQTACEQLVAGLVSGVLGGDVTTTYQTDDTDSGSGATDNGTDILSDDDDSGGILPQSSLPSPPGLGGSSLSSPDASGIAIAQGNLGSENAEYKLVIARDDLLAQAQSQKTNQPTLTLVNKAYATGSDCPEDLDYDACVDVESDGSFIAAIDDMQTNTSLNYYFYDSETGELSEAETDSPISELVHLTQKFISVTEDDGVLYGVTETGHVIKLVYNVDDGRLEVSGDYEDDYLIAAFDESVARFIYNPAEDTFLFLNDDGELSEQEMNENDASFASTGNDSLEICNPADGCYATNMKLYEEDLFFSAYFDEGSYSDSGDIFEMYSAGESNIPFMASDYTNEYQIAEVKAFDVWEGNVLGEFATINIVEDSNGDFRIFGKYNLNFAEFSTIDRSLSDATHTDIYDLIVIEEQSELDPENPEGRALFLSDVGVTFFDFDIVDNNDPAAIRIVSTVEISNAIAIVTNADETTAYVLSSSDANSSDDDIITVVDLVAEEIDTSVGTDGVIQLEDLLDGKSASDLSPRSITFFSQGGNDYLFVGLNTTDDAFKNSGLVIEL